MSKLFSRSGGLFLQIIKFGIVGVIATLIDYAVYLVCTRGFHWDVLWSQAVAFALSLVVNFILSMKFVFRAKEGLSLRWQILIFLVSSLIGFGINEGLLALGDYIFDYSVYPFADLLVKVVATVVSMTWNFISKKLFLESRAPSSEPPENP